MAEILDIIVITLLVVAIVYGIILNRKIVLLQQSKQELANLFMSFDETILKAQIGIDDLKKVSDEVSTLLNQKMDKAYLLLDDLTFLSEKASQVTNIIDEKLKNSQKAVAAELAKERKPKTTTNNNGFNPKPEDIRAMRQQRPVANINSSNSQNNIKPFVNKSKAKALEAMLEQINENKKPPQKSKSNAGYSKNKEDDEEKIVANMLKAMGYGES